MFILFVLLFAVFLDLILLQDLLSVILRVWYCTLVHINEKLRKNKNTTITFFYFKLLPEVEEYTFKKENSTYPRDKQDTFNIQILMFSQGDIRLRQGSTCPVGVFLVTISLLTKKICSSKHLSWGNTFWEIFLFSSHIWILSCIYILLK